MKYLGGRNFQWFFEHNPFHTFQQGRGGQRSIIGIIISQVCEQEQKIISDLLFEKEGGRKNMSIIAKSRQTSCNKTEGKIDKTEGFTEVKLRYVRQRLRHQAKSRSRLLPLGITPLMSNSIARGSELP